MYWDLVDTQRASGIIAAATKMAVQVNLNKPSGGVRPLTMLEESFKAIEGPVARRKTEARRTWPNGTVYHSFNLAGEVAKRAAPEVLYTDALVCEDVMKYNRQFCCTPSNFEKYYNVIQTASCEAVEECMGIPVEATSTTAEAFSGFSIGIETRWGVPPPYFSKHGICLRICVWP